KKIIKLFIHQEFEYKRNKRKHAQNERRYGACEPVYKNACDAACNRKRNKAHKALAMKCKLLNTGLLAVVFHIFLKPLLGTVLLRGAGLSGPDFIADLCDSFYSVFGLAFNVIILAVFECDFHNKK